MTDPIADLLTRIRNAYAAHHESVDIPHSKLKEELVKTIAEHGYVTGSETVDNEAGHKTLRVQLKYSGRSPAISKIQRVSSPGRRIYSTAKEVKPVLSGHGIRIISTSKGIMVDAKARQQNLGGEVICKIW
jgi:small subunit ribosomal protein S8